MAVIKVSHLTKDFGQHKGIFDISFEINKGEIIGFLGPNGSGKTTTIRHLLGFMKANQGQAHILGFDCFSQVDQVQNYLGYLPGEITLMNEMTGMEFIQWIANMKNVKDLNKAYELIHFFECDAHRQIKKMSKGMKQKIALIVAFMQDAPILILDEPTSGLDPFMQQKFIQLIKKEKSEGKTILISSHIFEEIENCCDRIIMIKEGKIITTEVMSKFKTNQHKYYDIVFHHEHDAQSFEQKYICTRHHKTIFLRYKGHIQPFLQDLSQYEIDDLNVRSQTLEELFLHFYGD